MTKEIKFRAWSKERNTMIYPSEKGWYEKAFLGSNGFWQTTQLDRVLNHPEITPMQFTGLYDKNGTPIYEGDIVKGKAYEFNGCPRIIGEVIYDYCEFKVSSVRDKTSKMKAELNTTYEVIGNKFENEDLLS